MSCVLLKLSTPIFQTKAEWIYWETGTQVWFLCPIMTWWNDQISQEECEGTGCPLNMARTTTGSKSPLSINYKVPIPYHLGMLLLNPFFSPLTGFPPTPFSWPNDLRHIWQRNRHAYSLPDWVRTVNKCITICQRTSIKRKNKRKMNKDEGQKPRRGVVITIITTILYWAPEVSRWMHYLDSPIWSSQQP